MKNSNRVSICKKNLCLHADGTNADLVVGFLILLGIAVAAKQLS